MCLEFQIIYGHIYICYFIILSFNIEKNYTLYNTTISAKIKCHKTSKQITVQSWLNRPPAENMNVVIISLQPKA